eukprot:scaffold198724_cov35-Attheya_sp.AAC.1
MKSLLLISFPLLLFNLSFASYMVDICLFFCDGCTHARICNQCEARFDFCRDCRGAPVSRRVPE